MGNEESHLQEIDLELAIHLFSSTLAAASRRDVTKMEIST